MKIGPSYRTRPDASGIRVAPAVPKGALVMCTFLVGMTGIGASAYALRDQIFNNPVADMNIPDRMPLPASQSSVQVTPLLGGTARHESLPPEVPQLASLAPSHTQLEENLFSPLSRIFLGAPPISPPNRPGTEAEAETPDAPETPDIDTDADIETEIAGLARSLRPKQRPSGLETNSASIDEAIRLASLSAPESVAPPEATDDTDVPDTPRVVAPSAQCPKRLAREVPRRRSGASSADTVLASMRGVQGVERDNLMLREILKGNMPGFQKNLVPVSMRGKTSDGKTAQVTLCVTPDYLALGSDRDFVRIPLGLKAAARVASEFNMLLPTPRMVDAIYRQAGVRLAPRPMSPGPQMTSTAYFMRHNDTVEAQRRSTGAATGVLISGHKKDLVLTTRLASNRGRVAIYGWHRTNGQPIQPLSTVHGAGYADYSHGIRLVSRTAYLNGREVDLRSLIADPRYAGLLSHEGPLGRAVLASN